jgi:hypothetical protein
MLETSQKRSLASFRPECLRYGYVPEIGGFAHNFERDLHVFVLWERSQVHWDAILADLSTRFCVVFVACVEWPKDQVENNFLRLYGMPPRDDASKEPSRRSAAVGAGPFMLVVVEDLAPVYVVDRTFSKKIEIVNRSVAAAKAQYRALCGGGFRVHSSNSLGEFFRDATLLLGVTRLNDILATSGQPSGGIETLALDLAGGQGWSSMELLFQHLVRASGCVILRNFDELPHRLLDGDGDIDVLCRDKADLAAIVNGRVLIDVGGKFACETTVDGTKLQFDVRFVGDGYYDEYWQNEVIRSAVPHNRCVMVPSADHHFFTLLYHAKVHKKTVKAEYRLRLRALADQLGLAAYRDVDLTDDAVASELLAGYMCANRFRPTMPLDLWVGQNQSFISRLQAEGLLWGRDRTRDKLRIAAILANTPLLWRAQRVLTGPVTSGYRALKKIAYRGA